MIPRPNNSVKNRVGGGGADANYTSLQWPTEEEEEEASVAAIIINAPPRALTSCRLMVQRKIKIKREREKLCLCVSLMRNKMD